MSAIVLALSAGWSGSCSEWPDRVAVEAVIENVERGLADQGRRDLAAQGYARGRRLDQRLWHARAGP